MKLMMMVLMVVVSVFAEESLRGKKIVFDHNGKRQVATIGTNTVVKGDARLVSVSWLEKGKYSGNTSRAVSVNLNTPSLSLEASSLPLTLQNKKVDLKAGEMVIGKDNNIYEVVAVFANGEVGLRPFESKYRKLKPKVEVVVQSSDFIETVSQKCMGKVCFDALIAINQSFKLCSIQRVGYYKKNNLTEDKNDVADCNIKQGKESQVVSHVFADGTIVADGEVHRRALAPEAPVDAADGVAQ